MNRAVKSFGFLCVLAFLSTLTNNCSKKDENFSITSIQADNKQYEVEVGSTVDLSVITTPVNIADKSLIWVSSDSKIATVTKKNEKTAVIKGVSEGYINVIVYYNSFVKASFGVTVKSLPLSATISPDEATIEVKKTITLKINPTVENPNEVFEWKSLNEAIATVSSSGVVTGKQPGVVTILATGRTSGAVGSAKITVTPPYVPLSRIDLSQNPTSVSLNGDLMLTAVVLPADATNKNVTWSSSDPNVATVDPATGKLSGTKIGTVTVTATSKADETKKGTISITVKMVPVTSVSLDRSSVSLTSDTTTLVATVLPADASDKTVTWSSSNTSVATVSATGEVTPKAIGTADIKATSNSDSTKSAISKITVTSVPVASVALDGTTRTLVVGAIVKITATVYPDNATNKNVTWSSSDPGVVTVGTDGGIDPKAPGTAVITATTVDGNKTATATITVIIPVRGVALSVSNADYVNVSETVIWVATVSPANASNKNLIWSSSDTRIATVSQTGVVTGVSAGTVTITAASEENDTFRGNMLVKVVDYNN